MSRNRNKPQLDYNVLHRTGKRVEKVTELDLDQLAENFENLNKMSAVQKLKDNEKQLASNMEEFISLNEIRGLGDFEYCDEYRSELLDFYKKFKNLHEDDRRNW